MKAKFLADFGDLENALVALDQTESDISDASSVRFSSGYRDVGRARLKGNVAAIYPMIAAYRAQINGDWQIAEANFRLAYDRRFNFPLDFGPMHLDEMRTAISRNLVRQGRIPEAEFEVRGRLARAT